MVTRLTSQENLGFYERARLLCAYYGYQAAAPGRPLLFMGRVAVLGFLGSVVGGKHLQNLGFWLISGQEYGQGGEWNCYQSLDWHEGEEPARKGLCMWVSDLMATYNFHKPLHMGDDQPDGRQFPVGAKSFDWVSWNCKGNTLEKRVGGLKLRRFFIVQVFNSGL